MSEEKAHWPEDPTMVLCQISSMSFRRVEHIHATGGFYY